MTETTRSPIEGPDPALLTDDEIAEAAMRIAGIGQVLAGTPGESVSAGQLAALDPAPRFICDGLQTLLQVLLAENERRNLIEDADILVGLSKLLNDQNDEA